MDTIRTGKRRSNCCFFDTAGTGLERRLDSGTTTYHLTLVMLLASIEERISVVSDSLLEDVLILDEEQIGFDAVMSLEFQQRPTDR